jgi:hypothetical protein
MKNILFLAILLIAGVVGYMYFFGKGEDKEKATEIVTETRELGRSVGEFLKRQKEKYDDGEFDRLLDKIGNTIEKLKSKRDKNTPEENQELRELEKELRQIDTDQLTEEKKQELQRLIDDLEKELANDQQ